MPLYRLRAGQKHDLNNRALRMGTGLRRLSPGDTIELTTDQYRAFRDKFDLVAPTPVEAAAQAQEVQQVQAVAPTIEHDGYGGYYAVNAVTGDRINEDPLSKEEAEELARVS